MIARYTRPEMAKLWSDKNRYQTWLDVELAVLDALVENEQIPAADVAVIRKKARINEKRILELEESLRHDVIAFTTSIAELCGTSGRFFHYGLTSSDVVDTSLAILMSKATKILQQDLEKLDFQLVRLAKRYKDLPSMGRTHGIHAEPMSFGLKFLGWVAEFRRHRKNLKRIARIIARGKLSGAVGVYGVLPPLVEKKALRFLKLKPEPVSTQVIPRDRHADFMCVIAQIGASIERVSVELRHLQRSEVSEVEEEFGTEQKGSSAMPHKKNPISAENLTGCSRLLRGYAVAALENVALWHERDISHSSVERVAVPDATILLDYMLHRLEQILTRLKVNEDQVAKNLTVTYGVFFSGHVLLAIVKKGMSREEGYRIVQKNAHKALEQKRLYLDVLWEDEQIQQLFTRKELEVVFNVKNYLGHVDTIYGRVLKDDALSSG